MKQTRDNVAAIRAYRETKAQNPRKAERLMNALIVDNEGLVHRIVRRELKAKAQNAANFDEACQEGRIGLLRAINDFAPDKGAFSTFAGFWIRHHVQTCAHRQGDFERQRSSRMPPAVAKACNKIRLLEGREPTAEDVGVTQAQWDNWLEKSFVVSLQEPSGDAGNYEDVVADTREHPDDDLTDVALRNQIDAALAEMSPRNRDLTKAIFIEGQTLESVGETFGISFQRVHQLRPVLERRLRKAIKLQTKPVSRAS
jgi:RNA polymerase sigma-32 factor